MNWISYICVFLQLFKSTKNIKIVPFFPGTNVALSRITKYSESEGSPESALHRTSQKTHHVPDSIVKNLTELLQAWCHHHFPGQYVPAFNSPLCEEPFPGIQPKLPPHNFRSFLWVLSLVTGQERSVLASPLPLRRL